MVVNHLWGTWGADRDERSDRRGAGRRQVHPHMSTPGIAQPVHAINAVPRAHFVHDDGCGIRACRDIGCPVRRITAAAARGVDEDRCAPGAQRRYDAFPMKWESTNMLCHSTAGGPAPTTVAQDAEIGRDREVWSWSGLS